jgi:hypothetical protein
MPLLKPRDGGGGRVIRVDDSDISYKIVSEGKRRGGGKENENGKQNLQPESVRQLEHER